MNRDEYFIDLLEAMAKALGYPFDRVELKRGIYSPKAHGEAELEQRIILRGLVELFTGRQPLSMKVTDFPVSQEALAAQTEYHRAMAEALREGRVVVQIRPRPESPFAEAAE